MNHAAAATLFLRLEVERHPIDAVTQSSGIWSIRKYMAEMCVAVAAPDFRAPHEQRTVLVFAYALPVHGFVEAGPAGAGIEFRV
jgi:hypothetical protein